MSGKNLIEFLRCVAVRADLLDDLKTRSKSEVIEAAGRFGLPFTEAEFDGIIWDLELRLAANRHEAFDAHFPLWQTLWGKYYFEYLVLDVMTSLGDADFAAVLTARGETL